MARNCHSKSERVAKAGQRCGAGETRRHGDTRDDGARGKRRREGLDFFPLLVDYEERYYAAGKVPGGFIKREGRPSESAILSGRMIDRSIRSLFPNGCATTYTSSRPSCPSTRKTRQHPRHQRRVARARDIRHSVERPDRRGAHRLHRRKARRPPRRERPPEQHARPHRSRDTAAASRWSRPEPKKSPKSCSWTPWSLRTRPSAK